MDRITAEMEIREFQEALKQYLKYSSLDVADAVNKKAGDVAFKAATARQVSGKKPEGKLNRLGENNPLWHALATGKTKKGRDKKGVAVRGKGNADVAKAIWNSRKSAVNYSKSLYLHLAKKFGKQVTAIRAGKTTGNAVGTLAGKGLLDKPEAILEILGIDASHEPILDAAMQHGIRGQIKDMQFYINRKIAERARAHSGRGR